VFKFILDPSVFYCQVGNNPNDCSVGGSSVL
jgi:hypothetical protein